MTTNEANAEPSRAEIDAQRGPLVIEFGTPTCGYCRSAQPAIAQALGPHPELQHIKITDGRTVWSNARRY